MLESEIAALTLLESAAPEMVADALEVTPEPVEAPAKRTRKKQLTLSDVALGKRQAGSCIRPYPSDPSLGLEEFLFLSSISAPVGSAYPPVVS